MPRRGAIYEHPRSARRFSAPPVCRRDLSRGYYNRFFWPGYLNVDGDIKQDFSTIKTIMEYSGRSVYVVDDTLCLKLLPICFDIDAIVRMMRTASQVVPVPRIHRYGRSGNCCYILTDFIDGEGLYPGWILSDKVPLWIMLARLEKSVRRVVEGLQGLGIAHHDFHYTNLIVDRYWGIAALFDWDYVVDGPGQEEYPRRAAQPTYPHVWDYLFAGSSAPFGTPFICSPVDGNSDKYNFTPALASSRETSTARDVSDHHLDPLICAQNIKAPDPVIVVLRGGDGSPVISYLDEHAGSIHGLHIARVFTDEKPSETLRQRSIATTSYTDVLHPLVTIQLIDFVAEHAIRTIDDEFARLVVRECPAIVILVNWRLPLANKFYEGLEWEMDLLNPNSVPIICRVNMYESHYPSPPESQPGLVLRCVHAHVSIPSRFGRPGYHWFTYSSNPVDAQDGQLLSYTAEYIESLAVRLVVQNYNAERSQWSTEG